MLIILYTYKKKKSVDNCRNIANRLLFSIFVWFSTKYKDNSKNIGNYWQILKKNGLNWLFCGNFFGLLEKIFHFYFVVFQCFISVNKIFFQKKLANSKRLISFAALFEN